MAKDTGPEEMGRDSANFRTQPGPLAEQRQDYYEGAIGGTHNVSVAINPETALTGGYTAIPGDRMPQCPGMPYLPKN